MPAPPRCPPGRFIASAPVLEAQSNRQPGSYERGTEEFSRVLAFSDGLFAIAMTLLVVGIAIPKLNGLPKDSVHDLANALNDRRRTSSASSSASR